MDWMAVPIQVNRRISPVFVDELTLLKREGFCLGFALPARQKVSPLTLEITSHRLRLYAAGDDSLSFECVWAALEPPQPVKSGFFSPQLLRVQCRTRQGFAFELRSADGRGIQEEFDALQRAMAAQPQTVFVAGAREEKAVLLRGMLERGKRELNQQEHEAYAKMQSLPVLFAHFDELLATVDFLARSAPGEDARREGVLALFAKIEFADQ